MRNIGLSWMLALAFVSCDNDDDATVSVDVQKESQAITDLVTVSYRNALSASSQDAVASAFTADGIVMGPGSPTAAGTAQLKTTYQAIFGAVGLNLNFKIDEIIVGKRYGFVRSTSAGTVTVKANGATAPEENRELFIVQKIDNDWKIARYIYNKMGALSQAPNSRVVENKPMNYSAEDSKEIGTLITATYANAIASSDAQTVANVFTSEGVLMAPDAPTMVGSAAIKSTYEAVFGALGLNLAFTIDEIVIDGEYGYVRSHSAGTALIRANGQTVPASYREIFVVKKVDGNWKIAWYKYNQPS